MKETVGVFPVPVVEMVPVLPMRIPSEAVTGALMYW